MLWLVSSQKDQPDMTGLDSLAPQRAPNAQRPLLGMTVLAVEDSRYASEALRLMCLRSGARIRRADCLASARRHLQVYRPSAVIVDLGLPDGRGEELIAELDRATPRVGVILATSGDAGAEARARSAGADGLLLKPVASLGIFQQEVLRHVPADRRPLGPYVVQDDRINPDPLAYRDDLEHVQSLLSHDRSPDILIYAAQFLASVARAANDAVLADAASGLAGHCPEAGIARVSGLIATRLAQQEAM
ncbi:response regulator [Roseovarius sp. 217]|nr:response regulator [Roseovarius sp. 217]